MTLDQQTPHAGLGDADSRPSTPDTGPHRTPLPCRHFLTKDEVITGVDCPHRLLLDQIADKWSVLILAALRAGPHRFNELKRRLDGITQKALTQSLRRLERNGIVSRTVLATSPVAVEYAITPLGETLRDPFAALYHWTIQYLPAVDEARARFDEASSD
ncbi:helix-turn-helix domain-containing protein [Robbsia sp. KACC 23696]|uniref:winged helix-turn-helix transcriptional regulator n=1 Tax=Robbsia sp. KACC 23696 TaxID=3149231 RepID=UPI00325BF41E